MFSARHQRKTDFVKWDRGLADSSALRSWQGGLLARQRAIEFGEEAAGLLVVSVEVALYAGLSLARPWSFWWCRSCSGGGG